jgi:hypothetical protein
MSTSFAFILAVLALVPATVWSYEGRVVDKDTGKPIEGAYVVAAWRGSLISPPERVSVCFHVNVTMTDKEGKFSFSDWSGNFDPLIVNRRMQPDVFYKAGYYWDLSKPFTTINNTFVLTPHRGTPEERFEQINGLRVPTNCEKPRDGKKLLPLLKEVFAEASAVAASPSQKAAADKWLFSVEVYEFDFLTASDRQSERRKKYLERKRIK